MTQLKTVSWDMEDVKSQFHIQNQMIAGMGHDIAKMKNVIAQLSTDLVKLIEENKQLKKWTEFEPWKETQHEVY